MFFWGCEKLETVTFNKKLSYVGGNSFLSCNNLNTVNIRSIASWCNIQFATYTANPLSIAPNLSLNGAKIENLEIPDSVSSIGKYAFYNYKALKSVTMGGMLKRVEYGAFEKCDNIETVHTPDAGTFSRIQFANISANPISISRNLYQDGALVEKVVIPDDVDSIGRFAFYTCENLKELVIGANVRHIGDWAFGNCKNLQEIHINDIKKWCNIKFESEKAHPFYSTTSPYISNLYIQGEKTTELVIPSGVSISPYAFYNVSGITSVAFATETENPQPVNIGQYAFSKCWGLKKVSGYVRNIEDYAFSACYYTETVDIYGGLQKINSYAFNQNSRLHSVSLHFQNVSGNSIQQSAFDYCYNLEKLYLYGRIDRISHFGTLGYGGIKELHVEDLELWCNVKPTRTTIHGATLFSNVNLYVNGQKIDDLVIPETVTNINECAFYGFNIKSVTIPESVKEIKDNAFGHCKNLSKAHIGDNVTTIGKSAFNNCSNLTDLYIGKSVESIENSAFYWCHNLTSVTIPASVKEIGSCAFGGGENRKTVYILATQPPRLQGGTVEGAVIDFGDSPTIYVPSEAYVTYRDHEKYGTLKIIIM